VDIDEIDEHERLLKIRKPFLAADSADWDRLIVHLMKDGSGHGQFWLRTMQEVRAAVETDKARKVT
jgi:hypothetical protein